MHRLAQRDFDRAISYFHRSGMKPVSKFIDAVADASEQIRLTPRIGSPVYTKYRAFSVKRYNYTLYYGQLTDDDTFIYAVAHNSRRPGYWLRRTRK
jgi:plasmid stabilization system protein ParE